MLENDDEWITRSSLGLRYSTMSNCCAELHQKLRAPSEKTKPSCSIIVAAQVGHPCSSPRPADGDAVHAQGGLADADRHALTVLAAGADAGIELEVIANHADAVEVGRAVADQHGTLEGLRALAILDLVGFRHLEHVFARGDVDLSAAEAHGIDAVLDRGDDLAGIAVAGEHVGIGHARHGHMGVALPAAIAGWLHVHKSCVLAVLHVAD